MNTYLFKQSPATGMRVQSHSIIPFPGNRLSNGKRSSCFADGIFLLSHDVESRSDITPCNKIDKSLVVTDSVSLLNNVHSNNVA